MIVRFFKLQQLFNLTTVFFFSFFSLCFSGNAEIPEDQRLEKLRTEVAKMKAEGPTLQRLETIGELFTSLKKYKNAAGAFYMATELDGATADTTLKLVDVYLIAGKTDGALSVLGTATQKFPGSVELLLAHAKVHLTIGNDSSAIVVLQKAEKIDPENPLIKYQLAEIRFHQGKFEETQTLLTPLVESDNPSVDAVLLYGQTLLEAGSARKGIRQVEKLHKSNMDSVKIRDIFVKMLLKAATMEGDAGRFSRAIKMVEQAHQIVPENIDILMGLALFHNKLGESQTAIQYCKDILSIDPEHLRMLTFLGRLQRMEGLSEEAEITFNKGLQLATQTGDSKHVEEFNKLLNPF